MGVVNGTLDCARIDFDSLLLGGCWCHPCLEDPCSGGRCLNYNKRGYTCDCEGTGRSGDHCQNDADTGELADPSFVWWASTTRLGIPPSPPPASPTQVVAYIPVESLGMGRATSPDHGAIVCDDVAAQLSIPQSRVVEIHAVVLGDYSVVTFYIEADDGPSAPSLPELLAALLTRQRNGELILDGATCTRLELLSSPAEISPPPPPKDSESDESSKPMDPVLAALVAVAAVSALLIIVLSTAVVVLVKRLRRSERVGGVGAPHHNEKRLSAV